jgi:hypothetical protein
LKIKKKYKKVNTEESDTAYKKTCPPGRNVAGLELIAVTQTDSTNFKLGVGKLTTLKSFSILSREHRVNPGLLHLAIL